MNDREKLISRLKADVRVLEEYLIKRPYSIEEKCFEGELIRDVTLAIVELEKSSSIPTTTRAIQGGKKMNKLANECSLKDTKVLRDLILENPELPLIIFCGEEAWSGEHPYVQAYTARGEIEELTLYGDKWLNKEDYEDELYDDLGYDEEYENMSDEEYAKMIDEKVAETEFVKAIVLWVG